MRQHLLSHCQQMDTISSTVSGFIAWQLVAWYALQHVALWHVQRPDVGVKLDVRTCVSAVCNREKMILLEGRTDFLRAQTLLGTKANCCEWERIICILKKSLEQYLIRKCL